jgi:hypothetical protein
MVSRRMDGSRFHQYGHDFPRESHEAGFDEFFGRSWRSTRHLRRAGVEGDDPEDVHLELLGYGARFEGTRSDNHHRCRGPRQLANLAGCPSCVSDSGDVGSHQEKNLVGGSDHLALPDGARQEPTTISEEVAVFGDKVRRRCPEFNVEGRGRIGAGGSHENVQPTRKLLHMGPVAGRIDHPLPLRHDQAGHTNSGGQSEPSRQITSGGIALGHDDRPFRGPDGAQHA